MIDVATYTGYFKTSFSTAIPSIQVTTRVFTGDPASGGTFLGFLGVDDTVWCDNMLYAYPYEVANMIPNDNVGALSD